MSDQVLLTETLLKQDEILNELLAVVVSQKEALKDGRLSDLQSLMSDLRHVSVRCQAIETKRVKTADELAKTLGCAPIVSEIAAALPPEDAPAVLDAAKALLKTVSKLKAEMAILPRLMEEAHTLNEMLINEWRKLGQSSAGVGSMGSFDTRI